MNDPAADPVSLPPDAALAALDALEHAIVDAARASMIATMQRALVALDAGSPPGRVLALVEMQCRLSREALAEVTLDVGPARAFGGGMGLGNPGLAGEQLNAALDVQRASLRATQLRDALAARGLAREQDDPEALVAAEAMRLDALGATGAPRSPLRLGAVASTEGLEAT